jgi:hypothetical protein
VRAALAIHQDLRVLVRTVGAGRDAPPKSYAIGLLVELQFIRTKLPPGDRVELAETDLERERRPGVTRDRAGLGERLGGMNAVVQIEGREGRDVDGPGGCPADVGRDYLRRTRAVGPLDRQLERVGRGRAGVLGDGEDRRIVAGDLVGVRSGIEVVPGVVQAVGPYP